MKATKTAKNWSEITPAPWPAIWAWIFLAIIFLGIANPLNFTLTVIKIGGIFLCLCYTFIIYPRDRLIQLAFLATFVADIVLAINNTAEIGILIFLIVQILHAIRLEGKHYITQIISFIVFALAMLIINLFTNFAPMLYVICGFYIVAIVTNTYISWRWWRRQLENLHAGSAFFGFALFLCCDICTGISYLSLINIFPGFLYSIANFFAWFFYYPSQVLVSNSSRLDAHIKQKSKAHNPDEDFPLL